MGIKYTAVLKMSDLLKQSTVLYLAQNIQELHVASLWLRTNL